MLMPLRPGAYRYSDSMHVGLGVISFFSTAESIKYPFPESRYSVLMPTADLR